MTLASASIASPQMIALGPTSKKGGLISKFFNIKTTSFSNYFYSNKIIQYPRANVKHVFALFFLFFEIQNENESNVLTFFPISAIIGEEKTARGKNMTAEQRRRRISELLKANDSVKVTELSKLFDVSEVTVRTDLEDMEKKGLLTRVHGGAVSSYKPYYSMNLNQRLETNQKEKVAIAEKIASLIRPNDTVMLNAGTTTLLVFRKFPADYNLNIVTNSVAIALEASGNPNYNVILVGGSVNTKYQFTYGHDAVKQLERYHADKLILSVDGIDIAHGFTTYYNKECTVDVTMLKQADTCIIAADRSKFGHSAFTKISDVSVADMIVTAGELPAEYTDEFKLLGVEVISN
ncbi:MAG: DeoR family transcriptional regulator [Ruminococcaceae bacterium]|nr:DeoR family transcriptional regulator [Oscillospiraceae bacterium]